MGICSVVEKYLALMLIFSFLSATAALPETQAGGSASDELKLFAAARAKGEVKGMQSAVSRLAQIGAIRKGMTIDEITSILGKPDSGTGIYVPGGSSIGYGKGQAGSEYHTFYWLHFRARDWNSENPKSPSLLIGWD